MLWVFPGREEGWEEGGLCLETVYMHRVGLVTGVATPSLGRGEGALVRSHSGHSFASTDASVWVKLESRYIH